MRIWTAEHQHRQNERRRERYASDPAHREHILQRTREEYRWRYRNDPAFRERRIEQALAYYYQKRGQEC